MILPLLAVGLGGLLQQHYREQAAEKVGQLLGTPETARAGEEGPVQVPGTGLLADPTNPTNQMKFAQGLMAQPGGYQALQAFQPMLNAAIQSKQWTAQHETQISQYQQTEDRLTGQFAKEFGLREEEARAMAQQRIQQQQNWEKEFALRQAEAAQSRTREGERLAMQREEHDWKRKKEQGAAAAGEPFGGAKPPTGYGIVPGAGGQPIMAPAPGTPDYAKATESDAAYGNIIKTVDKLVDTYAGPLTGEIAGQRDTSRAAGAEWWGPQKVEMMGQRGAIIAEIGRLRNTGVIDKNEYERLTESLPDPSSHTTSKDSFMAGYKETRRQMVAAQAAHRKAYPWLAGGQQDAGGGGGGGGKPPAPPPGFRPMR